VSLTAEYDQRIIRPGYEDLDRILALALEQAANGKGKERHGRKGETWDKQPIIRHQRAYGIGGVLFQAAKKMEEAMEMEDSRRARFELLGAIVYIAAAYLFLELKELEGAKTPVETDRAVTSSLQARMGEVVERPPLVLEDE
jgi:hypothetical protein